MSTNKPGRRPVAIDVVSYETGEVVKSVDVRGKAERTVDKVDRGMQINLDHEKYFTVVRHEADR